MPGVKSTRPNPVCVLVSRSPPTKNLNLENLRMMWVPHAEEGLISHPRRSWLGLGRVGIHRGRRWGNLWRNES
eukprot:810-Amorphochlora_amoeboformis.AAC.1